MTSRDETEQHARAGSLCAALLAEKIAPFDALELHIDDLTVVRTELACALVHISRGCPTHLPLCP